MFIFPAPLLDLCNFSPIPTSPSLVHMVLACLVEVSLRWFSTETGHRFLPLRVLLVRCRRLQDRLVFQSTTKSQDSQYFDDILLLLRARGHFDLDVGHIVGPVNYSRSDTKHRLPNTILLMQ